MKLRAARRRHGSAAVLADFDAFLLDHAACERKASATAMTSRRALPRPDRARARVPRARAGGARALRRVWELADGARRSCSGPTRRSPYMARLAREYRKGATPTSSTGCSSRESSRRAAASASAWWPRRCPEGDLKDFYRGHRAVRGPAPGDSTSSSRAATSRPRTVAARLDELLDVEARAVASFPCARRCTDRTAPCGSR